MQKPQIIGREEEISILQRLLESDAPEFLALYGRRRVGKTYLIKTYYQENLVFSCSGQYQGDTKEQLINFAEQLDKCFPQRKRQATPPTWQEAFKQLSNCIDSIQHKKKKVIFFDELSWFDNRRSGFLSSFSYFWNMYASQRNDILVVICGSAASWIIEKVINDKGGLHNRITQRIRLLPFTLKETDHYLQHRYIKMDHYQLLQIYMLMGGIPQYLNAIERGKSAAQNIDKICFSKDGALTNEFDNLYAALFNSSEKHVQLIKALARKNKGLTRKELLATGKLITGGSLTIILNELYESGFIEKIFPFENLERYTLYRLSDEFSLFYFRFMINQKNTGKVNWLNIIETSAYISWCGYAYENICLKHIHQIKKALQIAGIHTSASSWYKPGSDDTQGAQIDLLIDRADHCINLCEIKYTTQPFTITKRYVEDLQRKLMVFKQETGTRKVLLLTFVTTYGLVENKYRVQVTDNQLTMDVLFE